MKLTGDYRNVRIGNSSVRIRRAVGGVAEINANNQLDAARGLGYCHARDRATQMLTLRVAGRGRICECFVDSDESLEIDRFMRRMGFATTAAREVDALGKAARDITSAYSEGVNTALIDHSPSQYRPVGYTPEAWTPTDSLLTIGIMAYVGLAETQQLLEKFIIQAVHDGVDVDRLRSLFSPYLDGMDDEIVGLLRQIDLSESHVGPVDTTGFLPRMSGSNNWVLAGSKTASGAPYHCSDPHLQINRLPAIWCEVIIHTPDGYRMGATMPGTPMVQMGRTNDLSYSMTSGFMDEIDYFIERCENGRYLRDGEWVDIATHAETIKRKRHADDVCFVHETDLGVLEVDRQSASVEDGLHLCCAWSGYRTGAARTFDSFVETADAKTVPEAQRALRSVAISANWLLADRHGDIGYQQSGLMPARAHSGLHPVPAWRSELRWTGFVDPAELIAETNPECGWLATANNHVRDTNGADIGAINASMGPYRVERIGEVLDGNALLTLDDMRVLQRDVRSLQAERFFEHLRGAIPDTPVGRVFASWDFAYDRDSRGAVMFEDFYAALLREVFGAGLLGLPAWDEMSSTNFIVAHYYSIFDEALLGDDESWFGAETRISTFTRVLGDTLDRCDPEDLERWGDRCRFTLDNVFFQGKLPGFVKVDRGPIEVEGSRATVVQFGRVHIHGMPIAFGPSWRFVTEMATDIAETSLPGGVSDRPTSRLYRNDLKRWLNYAYKTIYCNRA